MADGSTKAIKDIKIGDKVEVTDSATGKTTTEPVGVLHDNHDSDLVDVDVRAADGSTSTLHTTAHHPFWDAGSGRWVEAAALKPGTRLQTLDGQTATVLGVHDRPGTQDMRDLTLIDIHTYYVIAGDEPVLVHNCGGAVGGHSPACDCANGGTPLGPRNASPAGGTHPVTGVPFDDQGFPDFSAWRHPDVPDVRIELTGNRSTVLCGSLKQVSVPLRTYGRLLDMLSE